MKKEMLSFGGVLLGVGVLAAGAVLVFGACSRAPETLTEQSVPATVGFTFKDVPFLYSVNTNGAPTGMTLVVLSEDQMRLAVETLIRSNSNWRLIRQNLNVVL